MTIDPNQLPQFLAVCENVAAGDTVAAACREAGVAERTFFKALAADAEGVLGQAYARARRFRADKRSSEIEDYVRRACLSKDNPEYLEPNAARVAVDSLKWLASRENQSRYGEKVLVEDTTAKKQLSREEVLAQLTGSGLRIEDVFASLTKRAGDEALAIEMPTPADDDLSGLDSQNNSPETR